MCCAWKFQVLERAFFVLEILPDRSLDADLVELLILLVAAIALNLRAQSIFHLVFATLLFQFFGNYEFYEDFRYIQVFVPNPAHLFIKFKGLLLRNFELHQWVTLNGLKPLEIEARIFLEVVCIDDLSQEWDLFYVLLVHYWIYNFCLF